MRSAGEPMIAKPAAGVPLLRLGFRPFFLGAALFAVLAVALWAIAYLGGLGSFTPRGGWLAWHMHEMPFGFVAAVIAGFLLTAVQNWTQSPGLHGGPLAALFLLWLAARIGWLWPAVPWPLLAAIELLFLPAVAARLGWQLVGARQRRNYPLLGLLALLTAADAVAMHALAQNDFILLRQSAWAALWLIGALISLIGGRIIPLFTANGLNLTVPRAGAPWLQRSAVGSLLLLAALAALDMALAPEVRWAPLFAVITGVHGWRAAHWFHAGVRHVPLLWSLHLGYLWLVVALAGFTAWHAGLPVSGSAALHAYTIGSVGGLILAMMARVSLGHTGRPLSPPRAMTCAFAAVTVAAVLRATLMATAPQLAVALSAGLWCVGFGLFAFRYAPLLCRPRSDGRPG